MRLLIPLFLLLVSIGNAQQKLIFSEWQQFVPSDKIPSEAKVQKGNNNLDAIQFEGVYYVAFRTAPSHFASKNTHLYIISSPDLENWKLEADFYMRSDMREPRFVEFQGRLLFYYFEGGTKPLRFQPKHIWMSERTVNGYWTQVENIGLDAYVPWRFRVQDSILYLSTYYGADLYKSHHSGDLCLMKSIDGKHFERISEETQIATKGAEEGEFEFDKDGNLWATIRLEGSGSYVAYASKDSLSKWSTTFSKHKYDSALMFNHQETMYVLARRHLKGEATPVENPNAKQRRKNLIRYSLSKKRTALYRIDKQTKCLIQLQDLPSTGDTAFPAIAKINENQYWVLNYSSNIHKKEKNWIKGQLGKTYIYSAILTID